MYKPPLILLLFSVISIRASEYYGTHVGRVRNASFALDGEVYLVNRTHLQIIEFNIKRAVDRSNVNFVFSDGGRKYIAPSVFEMKDEEKRPWLKDYSKELNKGVNSKRLIIEAPSDMKHWTHFGVSNTDTDQSISIIQLDKPAPEPYCCIGQEHGKFAIEGEYGVRVDPIQVLDAQTLLLPNFSFMGTKPPDGWIYAGMGEILQGTGKKALIIGRDEEFKHCAMHEDYQNQDMTVRLKGDQTVYDIDWISVFCYQYEHDFGHVAVNLLKKEHPVPAHLPELRTGAPARRQKVPCD